jgi:hypothetical protein
MAAELASVSLVVTGADIEEQNRASRVIQIRPRISRMTTTNSTSPKPPVGA